MYVSIADHGAQIDGATDDTMAWHDAIAAAVSAGIQEIRVPYGLSGVTLVNGPICNGPLPPNLRFVGYGRDTEGGGASTGYFAGPTIVYTGANTCWNIDYSAGSGGGLPGETGNWEWSNLAFRTTNVSASVFDFNTTATANVVEPGGPSYLRGVRFKNCSFFGAYGEQSQVGDAIKAAKCFELWLDKGCFVRGFRRGVWLKGCDNSRIDARFALNGRAVHLDRVGTFGSWTKISSEWLGNLVPSGGEAAYHVYDEMTNTVIFNTALEQIDSGATALLYLNGVGTNVIGCGGAGAPIFHLGAHAREVTLDTFGVAHSPSSIQPIIDDAFSNDFGYEEADYRLRIKNPSRHLQNLCGTHPRIRYLDELTGFLSVPFLKTPIVDSLGIRDKYYTITARDYWGKSTGTPAFGGITFAADPHAFCGQVIRLQQSVAGAGFFMPLKIGRHAQPGDILQLKIRSKTIAGPSGWCFAVLRNSAFVTLSGLNDSASFATTTATIDLANFAVGDDLYIGILAGSTPQSHCFIDAVQVSSVHPSISSPPANSGDTAAREAIADILKSLRREGIIAE